MSHDLDDSLSVAKTPRVWQTWLRRFVKILLLVVLIFVCRVVYRHFEVKRQLDAALAEMDRVDPGWRLEDIEAAREQVPEEENSARVVVAAAKLLPKPWPSAAFTEKFKQPAPQNQLSPDDLLLLEKELRDVEPALREARKLANMPRGRHRLEYSPLVFETLIPDQAEVRRVESLLLFDAMRQVQMNDMKAALTSCSASLNAARSFGDEPFAWSQLIRIGSVNNTCFAIARALAQGEPATDDLVAMQEALSREDSFPELLIAARGERASWHTTFQVLENGDEPISKLNELTSGGSDYAMAWAGRDTLRRWHPVLLRMMSVWVDIAQLPMHERIAAEEAFDVQIRIEKDRNPSGVRFIPALDKKFSHAVRHRHAYLRSLIVALACERFRHKRNKWPETLEALCPEYLASVPLDPFDGEPLRYRRLDDGVVIYTLGPDCRDNGGIFDLAQPIRPGTDMGCRLWNVAKRRQPPAKPG